MKVIIIIPAFNEQDSIGEVIKNLKKNYPSYDLIVIDDCSKDMTVKKAKEEKADIISMPLNLGIGAAVKCGYKYAYKSGYDLAIQFDADGQHRIDFIPILIEPIIKDEADMVIGSRFIIKGNYKSEFLRKFGINLFSFITSKIIRKKITDVTSGFRAINRKLLKFFSKYYPEDFPDAEAIIIASKFGFRITEVPVEMNNRIMGNSFFNWKRKIKYPLNTFISILASVFRSKKFYGD